MILEEFGVLATAQDLTDSNEISENVILMAAIDYTAITDLWWVVDTYTAAATVGTIRLSLVIATAANLGTSIEVCSVYAAAITDIRVANVGRHFAALNVGKQILNMLTTAGSDYPYVGMKPAISASTTYSINASLSPSEPPTECSTQVIRSNVGVPT